MFPLTQIPLSANGNIRPNRFITSVSGNGNFCLAVEATAATQTIFGVSGNETRYAPGSPGDDGFIAIAGEHLDYFGPLQIGQLVLGGTVSDMGIPLTSDSAGRGVATAPVDGTSNRYGAIALRPGLVGETIPVYILPPEFTC